MSDPDSPTGPASAASGGQDPLARAAAQGPLRDAGDDDNGSRHSAGGEAAEAHDSPAAGDEYHVDEGDVKGPDPLFSIYGPTAEENRERDRD